MFNLSLAGARSHSRSIVLAIALGALAFGSATAEAQLSTFGGNAQHTNVYSTPAQNINVIRWQTPIDNGSGEFAHYGEPLVTSNNTVIVPVLSPGDGVQMEAFDGATGVLKYSQSSDYQFPAHDWLPAVQSCLVGSRLYYPGAGGTIWYIDNADTSTPSTPTQLCFYGLGDYQANESGFNSSVYVNTPITADSSGNIYFGFRTDTTSPTPESFTQDGYAKITSAGVGTYVLAGQIMPTDANITRDCHNTAPALSNDESKLYVVVKWANNAYYGYLVALNTSDLSTSSSVFLLDPRINNGPQQPAGILDDGTASPVVAPDGDVFLGIFGNPYNGSRGFLSHFSGDLSKTYPDGGFGWDFTPGIVPASMVPSYNGTSSYLLFCKYNNYTGTGVDDGDGVNRVAVLDPNALETDTHASSGGLQIMREVETAIGFTPDIENSSIPFATREMCVNATCVNPSTDSVFFNSEDGHSYRWNLGSNQVTQALELTTGFGEPYVPTCVGPDGTVYTLNGTWLFAMGQTNSDSVTMMSSNPDSRTALTTTPITFTAHVDTNAIAMLVKHGPAVGILPTIQFTDNYYDGFTFVSNPIGSPIPLDGSGNASITLTLSAGGSQYGNHFINAAYSGNGLDDPSRVTLMQKVHAFATNTALTAVGSSTPYGQPVQLTATVTGVASTDIPTGQVTFLDGTTVIGQVPLDGTGNASFTTSSLGGGSHTLNAYYQSDTQFASSSGSAPESVTDGTNTSVSSSPNPSTYGTSVTFTATVTAADSGAGTPTGSVIFTIDGVAGSPVSVDSSGQAAFSTTTLQTGSHTVSAAFTGTNGWANSGGDGSDQDVTDGTNTAVGSSPNPSTSGQSVTFTATITAADSGAGIPSGSVVFTIDGSAGSPVSVDSSGKAIFSTTTLGVGSHTVSAAFTGTAGWGNSNGTGANQVVNSAVNQPPTQPQDVVVNPGPGKNKVTVTWQASTDPDGTVDHYEIWRSNKPVGGFSLAGTTTGTTFTDTVGNNQTRYFYVVAVDNLGAHSQPSSVASGASPNVDGGNGNGNGKG